VSLGVEAAFEVLGRARALEAQGRDIVHLEAGEPDIATPPHIIEAGVRAMRNGETRYTPSPGTAELRSAVAESLPARGVHAAPENVVITPGSKLLLFHALHALLEPGDDVLVPDPGYPAYASVTAFIGARPIGYPVDAACADGLDVEALATLITPRTRALVLNSPHNPTGTTVGHAALERIAELARRHDLMLISDEIYGRLTFGAEAAESVAALPGMAARTVIVDGFSKAYAMTGWRLGYGVMPVPVARAVAKLVNNSAACTPGFVQAAGVAALRGPQDSVSALVCALRTKRDRIVAGLNALSGVTCPLPGGAFYAFPDVTDALARMDLTAGALAERLLVDHGVACLPGSAFGVGAERRLRFSYATSLASIDTALDRLRPAVGVPQDGPPR
jgi:aspartate/methionine/tyrosine aminotransferase